LAQAILAQVILAVLPLPGAILAVLPLSYWRFSFDNVFASQDDYTVSLLHYMLKRWILIPVSLVVASLAEAAHCQWDTCSTVASGAQASILLQAQRARRSPGAPHGDVRPDGMHHWADPPSVMNARRRRGIFAETKAADAPHHERIYDDGIKLVAEQMETVQDGMVAFKTADTSRDVLGRSMMEMRDMQRLVMEIVAGLLFANLLAILSVCLCQAYKNHRAAPSIESQKGPVTARPTPAQILLQFGLHASEDARPWPGTRIRSKDPDSGHSAPAKANLVGDDVPPCDLVSSTGPLDSALSPSPPVATGSSSKEWHHQFDSFRTVDAFCTPGRVKSSTAFLAQ